MYLVVSNLAFVIANFYDNSGCLSIYMSLIFILMTYNYVLFDPFLGTLCQSIVMGILWLTANIQSKEANMLCALSGIDDKSVMHVAQICCIYEFLLILPFHVRPFRIPAILVGDGRLGGISGTISAYESLTLRGYDVVAVVLEDHGLLNEGPLMSYMRNK